LVAAVLVACGDDGGATSAVTTTSRPTTTTLGVTTTTPTATSIPKTTTPTATSIPATSASTSLSPTTTADGIDPMTGANRDPKTGPAGETGYGQLVNVAIGRHEGFDRVVFTFRGDRLPGYRVSYGERPVIQDGSGHEIAVDGAGLLFVRLEPASGYDFDAGAPSYRGPDRLHGIDAGASQVREVVKTGDFEAVLGWVIGLADVVDFRVLTLTGPGRLVVDVRNH
jgi:hypothetical protein